MNCESLVGMALLLVSLNFCCAPVALAEKSIDAQASLSNKSETGRQTSTGSNSENSWQTSTDEALSAYAGGDFKESERLLTTALEQSEKFGEKDERLYKSLENLALIYCKNGHYDKTEPLLKRTIQLRESQSGKNSIEIAQPPTAAKSGAALHERAQI